MKQTITCIVCPRGCAMTAHTAPDGTVTVTGNSCPRGQAHAVGELTAPVRSFTALVRVANLENTMLSVKSAAPIPKQALLPLAQQLLAVRVNAPVAIGDVILYDVYGTNVVATKSIK